MSTNPNQPLNDPSTQWIKHLHREKLAKWLQICLLALVVFFVTTLAFATEYANKSNECLRMRDTISSQQATINQMEADIDQLSALKQQLSDTVEEQNSRIRDLLSEVEHSRNLYALLESKYAVLEASRAYEEQIYADTFSILNNAFQQTLNSNRDLTDALLSSNRIFAEIAVATIEEEIDSYLSIPGY